jgi:hypothetical protein
MDMPKKPAPPATAGSVDVDNPLIRFSYALHRFLAAVIRMGQFHGKLADLSRERRDLQRLQIGFSVLPSEDVAEFRRLLSAISEVDLELKDAAVAAGLAVGDLERAAVPLPGPVDGVPPAMWRDRVLEDVDRLAQMAGARGADGREHPPTVSWLEGRPEGWAEMVNRLGDDVGRLLRLAHRAGQSPPDTSGWLTNTEAAALIGIAPSNVKGTKGLKIDDATGRIEPASAARVKLARDRRRDEMSSDLPENAKEIEQRLAMAEREQAERRRRPRR